jgi:hypothetical protein
MKMLFLYAVLCCASISCTSKNAYRKVRVVGESGAALQGVSPVPQTYFGRGAHRSDGEGFLYVPNGFFSLIKPGYKSLWVDVENTNKVFIMEIDTRPTEEAIEEDSAKAAEFLEKSRDYKASPKHDVADEPDEGL